MGLFRTQGPKEQVEARVAGSWPPDPVPMIQDLLPTSDFLTLPGLQGAPCPLTPLPTLQDIACTLRQWESLVPESGDPLSTSPATVGQMTSLSVSSPLKWNWSGTI